MPSFFKIAVLLVGGILAVLSPSNSTFFVAEDVFDLPPLPQEIHDFLQQCAPKLTPKCGEEIKEGIYHNGKVLMNVASCM